MGYRPATKVLIFLTKNITKFFNKISYFYSKKAVRHKAGVFFQTKISHWYPVTQLCLSYAFQPPTDSDSTECQYNGEYLHATLAAL